MKDLQNAKQAVIRFHAALDECDTQALEQVTASHTAEPFVWRGVYPFGVLHDAAAVANTFWKPLKCSLTALQRREDILFAGHNEIDGMKSIWVVSMGHLMGLFDRAWLGIPPTGKMVFLRYCTFHRVEGLKVAETVMHVDIPHFMAQVGKDPFSGQSAQHVVQPGPRTHQGLLFEPQIPADSEKTLALINAMIRDIGQWQSGLPLEEELARTWHDDMIWWGPAGIGATCTIERYAKQHAGPFRACFKERSKTSHIARLAEGHYGGFFGWPNFTATPTVPFAGLSTVERAVEFRVIDVYRRDGDKLAENWVFIDMLHFWRQQGVDILGNADGAR